jgi:hypothetical protein
MFCYVVSGKVRCSGEVSGEFSGELRCSGEVHNQIVFVFLFLVKLFFCFNEAKAEIFLLQ